MNCCSAEGFFPGGEDNSCFTSSKKHRVESLSASNLSTLSLHNSPSFEVSRKRRNKPLAVAVGFKYANDYNGRPIVITPGGRKSPSSGVTRSPIDPFQAARQHQGNGGRSPPHLPVLSLSCDNSVVTANNVPTART